MSGPKVVRIVTRDELVAICSGLIAQLTNVVAVCERDAARSQALSDALSTRWRSDVARLDHALQRDDFRAVQKDAPRLIAAIRQEMSSLIEEKHNAVAVARRRQSSLRQTARQLQSRLQNSQVQPSQDLVRQLHDAVAGKLQVDQMEEVVAQGLRSLPQSTEQELTPAQRQTLQNLSGDDSVRTFADWLAASQHEDPQIKQLSRYAGQLAACGATNASAALEAKIESIQLESNSQRRQLLTDSLCLEAVAQVRDEQQHATLAQHASDLKVAIHASGDAELCRSGLQRLEVAIGQRQTSVVEAEMKALQALHAEAIRQRSAQASRTALLAGLKELGYSVSEGMSTIWNQQKKLVVRHPQKKGIAVELGAVGQNNQFQARVVALQNESRDAKSDQQVETEWCDSLAQIQSKIAQAGSELRIERAVTAGQNPLKRILWESESTDSDQDLGRSRNNERRI